MQVRIEGIRRGRPKHATLTRFTYAKLVDATSGEVIISATLDYILDKVEERGYEVVSVSLNAKGVSQ
jgi:hypothetical protein